MLQEGRLLSEEARLPQVGGIIFHIFQQWFYICIALHRILLACIDRYGVCRFLFGTVLYELLWH
jgi:hypothetical protein